MAEEPKRIYVDGRWRIDPFTVDIVRSTRLEGPQSHARIKFVDKTGSYGLQLQSDDWEFSNLWFDFGGVNDTLLWCDAPGREVTVTNCFFENAGLGVHIDGWDEARLANIKAQSLGDSLVRVTNSEDVTVKGFEGEGAIKIDGSSTDRVNFSDGIVTDGTNGSNAVNLVNGSNINFSNVTAYGASTRGFHIQTDATLSGCTATGNGYRGVWFRGGANGATFHGEASGNDADGAGVPDMEFGDATNCTFHGVSDGDLEFTANATDCTVYGTVTGTVTNNGTGCSVV